MGLPSAALDDVQINAPTDSHVLTFCSTGEHFCERSAPSADIYVCFFKIRTN